ncbi:hypothetical protein P153DRAFT_434668 [Dothidotthia symphoricarpi CBS 119687]|uniref:MOSC domain-containing protein n=1 Tax=Dothidotthia symphoricarpi CBS 119687 TaxID=1392245 RepID=A0A6A6A2J7_9PLEO|nr:uncharacterized protein P153DRAFT_434668 [Dothidotthia symphoricarpi CBS 119687]KAF2124958.1 hypothetical protein P153DRAFT_434668 [Dothidotthia symphoricarpi CBS 119687]
MSSNILDDYIASAQKTLADAGINLTPLTILITLLVPLLSLVVLFGIVSSQGDKPLPPPTGCRKLGLRGRSNLEDQYSKKYARGADPTPAKPWTVKALFIYPVKSCGPVELEKSDIVRTGLKYDRQFSLAQQVTSLPSLEGEVTSEWHFLTQRKFPRLAKVEAEVWIPDPLAPGYKEDREWVKSEGCVVIRFPFSPDSDFSLGGLKNYAKIMAARLARRSEPMIEFKIPFNPSQERIMSKGYTNEVMNIWKDAPVALNMNSEVDREVLAKLKYTLGTSNPIALFRIDTKRYREVQKCAPKPEDVGFQTIIGMQDSYPLHILNLASVHDISSKLPQELLKLPLLNALRYRANIYITGPPAFHEDDWKKAMIGSVECHISCRTTRCKLPNVDPKTGIADKNEPGTTMRKYRVIDQGSKNACLGMQVTPLGVGEVKVGDSIEVLETGEHFYLGGSGRVIVG